MALGISLKASIPSTGGMFGKCKTKPLVRSSSAGTEFFLFGISSTKRRTTALFSSGPILAPPHDDGRDCTGGAPVSGPHARTDPSPAQAGFARQNRRNRSPASRSPFDFSGDISHLFGTPVDGRSAEPSYPGRTRKLQGTSGGTLRGG